MYNKYVYIYTVLYMYNKYVYIYIYCIIHVLYNKYVYIIYL